MMTEVSQRKKHPQQKNQKPEIKTASAAASPGPVRKIWSSRDANEAIFKCK